MLLDVCHYSIQVPTFELISYLSRTAFVESKKLDVVFLLFQYYFAKVLRLFELLYIYHSVFLKRRSLAFNKYRFLRSICRSDKTHTPYHRVYVQM